MMRKSQISSRSHNQQKQSDGETAGRDLMLFGTSPAHRGGVFLCSVSVRFWPKADIQIPPGYANMDPVVLRLFPSNSC